MGGGSPNVGKICSIDQRCPMQQILWVQFDRDMPGVVAGGAGLAAADLKVIETCGAYCLKLLTDFEHQLICICIHLRWSGMMRPNTQDGTSSSLRSESGL